MSENKTGVDKTSFVFGLVAGIAVISVIILLNQHFQSNGTVAGEVVKNDTPPAAAPSQPSQPDAAAPAANVKPLSKDDHVKGDPNAKVVLIEYSDFQCPYCLRHNQTMQQIEQDYGNKIAIAYRHFPLTSIHPEAQKAAEASECAAEQGKFWEMHDKIFDANAAGNMSVAAWKQSADTLGLNTQQFNSCLDSGKYANNVQQDASEGAAAGVKGTPATFINGQLVSGAVPYDQFKQIIDSDLQ